MIAGFFVILKDFSEIQRLTQGGKKRDFKKIETVTHTPRPFLFNPFGVMDVETTRGGGYCSQEL